MPRTLEKYSKEKKMQRGAGKARRSLYLFQSLQKGVLFVTDTTDTALAEQRYTRAVAEEEASHELTVDDGAGVFDDLGVRRSMADARAQSAQEVYLAEIAKAQCRLQPRTATAEEMTEVSNGEAAAGEAMVAPQQTEECSGATATQLQAQQCAIIICNKSARVKFIFMTGFDRNCCKNCGML